MAENNLPMKVRMFVSETNPLWTFMHDLESRFGGPSQLVQWQIDWQQENPTRHFAVHSYQPGGGRRKPGVRQPDARGSEEGEVPDQPGRRGGSNKAGPHRRYLGVSWTAIDNWQVGKASHFAELPASLKFLLDVLQMFESHAGNEPELGRLISQRKACVRQFQTLGLDRSVGLYEAGALLGLTVREVQEAIDATYQFDQPLLALAYYAKEPRTDENHAADLETLGGVYLMWLDRYRPDTNKLLHLQCALEIRYAQNPLSRDKYRVLRAKLVLPDLGTARVLRMPADDDTDWHYDGFVRRVGERAYFVLEKRGGGRADFFHLITSASSELAGIRGEPVVLDGYYLTCDQDGRQQTPVTGRATLVRKVAYEAMREGASFWHVLRERQGDGADFSGAAGAAHPDMFGPDGATGPAIDPRVLATSTVTNLRAQPWAQGTAPHVLVAVRERMSRDIGHQHRMLTHEWPCELTEGSAEYKEMMRVRLAIAKADSPTLGRVATQQPPWYLPANRTNGAKGGNTRHTPYKDKARRTDTADKAKKAGASPRKPKRGPRGNATGQG